MVKKIAGKVGLSAVLAVETGSDHGGWIAQQNEAPLEFLERTARRHNALFSIKNGELIFVRKGELASSQWRDYGQRVLTQSRLTQGSCRF